MQVMILAAGKSTRLGSLGAVLPKPLVPICGYPAISFGLALCQRAGLTDVVVNLHHHGDLIRQALGDGTRHGVTIRYSDESDELLGTGGGVKRARPLFRSEPVLVMNGKVVADLDLRAVIEAHRSMPTGTAATMVLREYPPGWQRERADATIDATGAVISLRAQRTDRTPVGPIADRLFTGIHIVERDLLDRLPDGASDMIADAYLPALLEGRRIHSLTIPGYFAEHSTPERYLAGNLALLRDPSLVPVTPGPLVGVDPEAQVHPSAQVLMPSRIAAGAVVEEGAVVGPDAVVCGGGRVAARARVERSVVWSGAAATGVVADAVLTGDSAA